jgi:ribosomal protein S20
MPDETDQRPLPSRFDHQLAATVSRLTRQSFDEPAIKTLAKAVSALIKNQDLIVAQLQAIQDRIDRRVKFS